MLGPSLLFSMRFVYSTAAPLFRFNADGSSFTGPWGRPQNDGPGKNIVLPIIYTVFN